MMNLPYKFRTQVGYCSPKGPAFKRAQTIRFTVEGTQIEFKAPKHRPKYRSVEERCVQDSYSYNYDDKNPWGYLVFGTQPLSVVVDKSWKIAYLFHRAWLFNGDWFTGPLADMTLSLGMVMQAVPEPEKAFFGSPTPTPPVPERPKVSFFHPRAFENAVGDFLTNNYSKYRPHGRPEYMAPLNWKPLHNWPCVCAYLEVERSAHVDLTRARDKYVFFPVDDTHLMYLRFHPRRYENEPPEEMDKLVDARPMEELMQQVIASFKLTLSPAAQAQQKSALEGLDNTALREQFPPMKWSTAEEDAEWEEYNKPYEL